MYISDVSRERFNYSSRSFSLPNPGRLASPALIDKVWGFTGDDTLNFDRVDRVDFRIDKSLRISTSTGNDSLNTQLANRALILQGQLSDGADRSTLKTHVVNRVTFPIRNNHADMEQLLGDHSILVSPYSISSLRSYVQSYRAGNLRHFISNWEVLTSDKEIMSIVKYGLTINKIKDIEPRPPHQYGMSPKETEGIQAQIGHMLRKGVIAHTTVEDHDYFSPIFAREKSNGEFRIILNLKQLNKSVLTHHFKMDSIRNVKHMIELGCWMASVDLKDAFYSVPVHPRHHRYLKFIWDGTPYYYTCMPNGYSDAMRIFTKLLKPPFACLRKAGFPSVVYVDDTYLQHRTFEGCQQNVYATLNVLSALGFTTHVDKSVLVPTQRIEFLGFILDSRDMSITLTDRKKEKILKLCHNILADPNPSIRRVSQLIGNLVATSEAVPLARLHYKALELDKIAALERAKGNFEAAMRFSRTAINDIHWWIEYIPSATSPINIPPYDKVIFTDASKEGWGATSDGVSTQGRWTLDDISLNDGDTLNINI